MLAAPVRGVLFDYGNTLVRFDRPHDALREAYAAVGVRLGELLPGDGPIPTPEVLIRGVHDRVDAVVRAHEASGALDEVDLEPVYAEAYAELTGVALDPVTLDELVRMEQRAWFAGARPTPDATATLVALRDQGRRVGLCSNAPYHAATLREQLARVGLGHLLDSVTLSSDVGRRKPAPDFFRRAVDGLGTAPGETIHVGDRLREDVDGARGAGLRAVWLAGRDAPRHWPGADAVIRRLGELVPLLPPSTG